MEKICFVLSPLGAPNSEIRRYSDDFFDLIVHPAVEIFDYSVVRVDKFTSVGSITRDILEYLFKADLVIADLSYSNPNVMYELGVRHSTGKPVIIMAKEGEKLPFDLATVRTIMYSLDNAKDIRTAIQILRKTISYLETNKQTDSPVIDAEITSKINYATPDISNKDLSTSEVEASLKTLIDRIGNLESSLRLIGKEVTKKSLVEYSRDVFIVHGHDGELKNELARLLEKLNFNPIILHEQADKGVTIIQKLQFESSKVGYSFILYTPDDEGRKSGDTKELKKRSRQNVIFEHGVFVGKFNPERVCAIVKADVEIPSDLSGVVYKKIPPEGSIMTIAIDIITELKAAGYKIDANKIFKEL